MSMDDVVPQNLAQAGLAVPALVLADGLSYEDYFRQINKMAEQMRTRWQREEKVGALKVSIQLSKLLADTSQPKLYPKKYSRVMEILDEFGSYIYNRVHSIAETTEPNGESDGSAVYFNSHELAKDIYRNWQFKILSIRELVPRFYTELAILRASDILFASTSSSLSSSRSTNIRYLQEQFSLQSLERLSNQCMGFGDPIVSLHARAYLCKVAERLIKWNACSGGAPGESILFSVLAMNLKASTTLICRMEMSSIQATDLGLYFELLTTSYQSMLNIISTRYNFLHDQQQEGEDVEDHVVTASMQAQLTSLFEDILATMALEDPCNFRRNIILNSLFVSLPGDICSNNAARLLNEVETSHDRWVHLPQQQQQKPLEPHLNDKTNDNGKLNNNNSMHHMIPTIYTSVSNFLTALDGSATFEEQRSSRELSSSPLQSPVSLESSILTLAEVIANDLLEHEQGSITSNYLRCFKALLTFASHHARDRLNHPLTTLVRHLSQGRQYMNHHGHIMDIIKTLFTQQYKSLDEIKSVVALRSFNQLFDFLRKDEHRLDVSKYIMEMLRSNIKLNYNNNNHKPSGDGRRLQATLISDRVIINFLLKLFGALNNSLSPLAAQEDLTHLSDIVVFLIDLVAYEDHLELVEFYSRCRSCLGNLNLALEFLIKRVLELPQSHRKTEKRRNARQNILNCCLAFAFTTLPAVQNQRARVDYYISGCKLALTYKSLSLADYFMRQIMVNLLSQVEGHEAQQEQLQLQLLQSHDHQGKSEPMVIHLIDPTVQSQVSNLLELMIKYQDYIDLKHKLTLSQLIRMSVIGQGRSGSDLKRTLDQLNCVDDTIVTDASDAAAAATTTNS